MKMLILFIAISLVNVIASTIRSLVTIKGGKTVAAVSSALYFAYYNIVLIYTVADFPLWQKCLVTFFCNLVGVYIVKFAETKVRKDKLWKIEATFSTFLIHDVEKELQDIPHSYIVLSGKHTLFNIYSDNQQQSEIISQVCKKYNGKIFATESVNFY